ncbi:GNAT family N-acetyltransferase [Saccharibacillus deserti]|uniref:GNAT family N-acetyltransferase n=1 Tax=Saccharibacillus deserti TaxID=1634444 RepID=UPI0015563730|nr:GNAT family N-acetyltransferase [Saccharibacillus deserti]
MQPIRTERLLLRNFAKKDAPHLLEYAANPQVNCFLDEKVPDLEAAVLKVTENSRDDSHIAVCLQKDDRLIGELFAIKEEPDTYSVGWNFNPRCEGQGYAGESCRALLHYLFTQMNARRLYAYVEDDNRRSQQLCERLGMRQEGLFLEFVSFTSHPDGTPKYENTFQYALLKQEWLSARQVD